MSLQITSAHKLADFKCDIMSLALVKGPVFGGGNTQMCTNIKLLVHVSKKMFFFMDSY